MKTLSPDALLAGAGGITRSVPNVQQIVNELQIESQEAASSH